MTYKESVDWLFRQFPAFQNVGASAYKPDIENVSKLLDALGTPQKRLRFIHIAGTNGKGSTSHIIAALAQAHGLRTGLFTSPHLVDFRERIKVDGVQVSQQEVVSWVEKIIPSLNLNYAPSFFELTFALALCYFENQNCDLCVIETGLGGRLDATNIIEPVLSVITNIGLDHQQFLGDTRTQIAYEKAGIIKKNKPVLIAEKDAETIAVFENKSKNVQSELRWVKQMIPLETDLQGHFQQVNIQTAWQAFQWFCEKEQFSFQEELARISIKEIARRTGFRGRMELIQSNPKVIFDVAHNTHGIRALMQEIKTMNYDKLFLLFGSSGDKDIQDLNTYFPSESQLNFTVFENFRSRALEDWSSLKPIYFPSAKVYSNAVNAYKEVLNQAASNDLIIVFGSFFLIGELIEKLEL